MRNRLFFISIAILLLLPASLCVADDQVNIDGKWKCEAPGGQGVNAKIRRAEARSIRRRQGRREGSRQQ